MGVQVAAAAHVPVVDLWSRLQTHDNWRALLSDGLHLSPLGNQAVFAEIKHVLTKELPSITPDMLPLDLPEQKELTNETAAHVIAPYMPPM